MQPVMKCIVCDYKDALSEGPFLCTRNYLLLVDLQTFQEPPQLLPGQGTDLRSVPWPLVSASVEPVVQEGHSIRLKIQNFNAVGFSPTEEKRCIFKRIHLKRTLQDPHQSIQGFPHIGPAGHNVEVPAAG